MTAASPARDSSPSKLHALIAEDNAADVFMIEEAIEVHHVPVEVLVANDGQKAVEVIEAADRDVSVPCPDIVLLDLNLPRRSGLEVLQKIRQSPRCKDIPVLIMSSSDSVEDRSDTARLGANGYFRKPANYDQYLKLGEVLINLIRSSAANCS